MDAPDLERLTRELILRKRLQETFLVFSRGVAAKLSLTTALESFSRELNELFGTACTSVWLFDRDTSLLTLAASSDPRESATSVLRGDEDSLIARALRRDAPERSGKGPGACLAAPMRGWRRALGTLVFDGEPSGLTEEQFVELSAGVARQLALPLENLQVVDEAIRRYGEDKELRLRLAQSEKLAGLGQVVAGIAHEMNDPLQGVLGHLELLMVRLGRDAPEHAALERIYNDIDGATRIVQNLLLLVGGQRPEPSARRPDPGR